MLNTNLPVTALNTLNEVVYFPPQKMSWDSRTRKWTKVGFSKKRDRIMAAKYSALSDCPINPKVPKLDALLPGVEFSWFKEVKVK
jgi:hypothetical protein